MTKGKKGAKVEVVKWFGPLLDALRTLGNSGRPKEVAAQIATDLKLPDAVLEEVLKSGELRFENQIRWARLYLVYEGLLEDSTRGIWALTKTGMEKYLSDSEAVEIYQKWSAIRAKTKKEKIDKQVINIDGEHELTKSSEIEHIFTPTLLEVLKSVSPKGFEDICKRLLREHGFENVHVTGNPHDGGIDGYGTLELNAFVTMKVLFQCKRYRGTVSRAQVGDFRNAVLGRVEKGIIMTTGTYSEDAKREAYRDGVIPIELIDGQKLVELFESVELGVKRKIVYDVDLNFFEPYMETRRDKI